MVVMFVSQFILLCRFCFLLESVSFFCMFVLVSFLFFRFFLNSFRILLRHLGFYLHTRKTYLFETNKNVINYKNTGYISSAFIALGRTIWREKKARGWESVRHLGLPY